MPHNQRENMPVCPEMARRMGLAHEDLKTATVKKKKECAPESKWGKLI